MKILFLSPVLPYPLTSGGRIRAYNLLKQILPKHQVTLVSYHRQETKDQIKQVKRLCHQLLIVERRHIWSPVNLALSALGPFPLLVNSYLSIEARRKLRRLLTKHRFDLIWAETFYTLPILLGLKLPPVILTEHNIEYLTYQQYAAPKRPPLSWLLQLDVTKLKYWEQRYWSMVDQLVAVSSQDQQLMTEYTNRTDIKVLPNGIDLTFFASSNKPPRQEKLVIFVGNYKWLPNQEAAAYLVKKVWPLVRKQQPDAQLLIAGRNPTPAIYQLAKLSGVKVKADLPDIRQLYQQAAVMLAPIISGKGTRYKILEALASQLPVVTTALGAQGLNLVPDQDILVGETPKQLAAHTVKLLNHSQLRSKLRRSGYSAVKQYSWTKIAGTIDQILQQNQV